MRLQVTARRVFDLVVLSLAVAMLGPGSIIKAEAQASVEQRLNRVERALDNKGLLDLVRQVEMLNEQLRKLRGELENQTFAVEQVRQSQRSAYVDIDRRVSLLEQGGIISVPPANAAGVAVQAPTGIANEPPLSTLAPTTGSSIAGDPAGQSIALNVETPGVAVGASSVAPPGTALISDAPSVAIAPASPAASMGAQAPSLNGDGLAAPAKEDMTFTADAASPSVAVTPTAPAPSIMPATATVDSAESEAAYRDAFAMLKAGQYEESIAAFDTFLAQYGNSQYADNAQYWLGEAHYVMRQFEPAIDRYQKLVQTYPDSKKQSHALLKIAYSYHELGMAEQATGVLGDLKNRFPGTAAARLADERLQRIRADSP